LHQKTTEQLRKFEAKRQELLKKVKETTITVQKINDVVGIPSDVWLKAKMFNAQLKNAGHVYGMKMVIFIMDQRSRIDAYLNSMKALIASCTELFPVMVESLEDEKTSSSYSDLTPQDLVEIQKVAAEGKNQQVEEENQVEDITALTVPPISATEVVVPNATPISSIVGKETLDGYHVAEVTPPSPPLTFHVVIKAPPPLAPRSCEHPATRTPCAELYGDWRPHWSDSRDQWAQGASSTITCFIFGNR
jgi:hypothetical protein